MVGTRFWYTGVTLSFFDDKWGASLDFLDDGFCDRASTQGTLQSRYPVGTMAEAIDLVLADAERLGFVLNAPLGPHIYAPGDGENGQADHFPADWRAQIRSESERRGWPCLYEADA